MSGTASKMMLQDPSSCHVLKGAWGKTSSGAGKYFPNLHAGKRSFTQMIKSAAHTVLLLIFVVQTAQSMKDPRKVTKRLHNTCSKELTELEDDLQQLLIEAAFIINKQGNLRARDDDKLWQKMERIKELREKAESDKDEEVVDELRELVNDFDAHTSASIPTDAQASDALNAIAAKQEALGFDRVPLSKDAKHPYSEIPYTRLSFRNFPLSGDELVRNGWVPGLRIYPAVKTYRCHTQIAKRFLLAGCPNKAGNSYEYFVLDKQVYLKKGFRMSRLYRLECRGGIWKRDTPFFVNGEYVPPTPPPKRL